MKSALLWVPTVACLSKYLHPGKKISHTGINILYSSTVLSSMYEVSSIHFPVLTADIDTKKFVTKNY
jgi:hypothetical protein